MSAVNSSLNINCQTDRQTDIYTFFTDAAAFHCQVDDSTVSENSGHEAGPEPTWDKGDDVGVSERRQLLLQREKITQDDALDYSWNYWTTAGITGLQLELLDYSWNYWTAAGVTGLQLGLLDYSWGYWTTAGIIGLQLELLDCSWGYWTTAGVTGIQLELLDYSWGYWTAAGTCTAEH